VDVHRCHRRVTYYKCIALTITTTAHMSVTKSTFNKACKAFLQTQPVIQEKKDQLKAVQKESKAHVAIIKTYMTANDVTEFTVGGFTFTNDISERLPWSEKNVAQLIEPDSDFFERYREQFAKTKQQFKCRPPKRQREAEDEPVHSA
jgi:hypothetical protein